MKVTYQVSMEIPDEDIACIAKWEGSELSTYKDGLVEDKLEILKTVVEDDGFEVSDNVGVE